MPRFVTVQLQCDWGGCTTVAEESEETVAETVLALDGKQAKGFLLCKAHREELEEVVMPLLQAGIKVEAPKKTRSPKAAASSEGTEPKGTGGGAGLQTFHCQESGCGRTLHNRTGMAQHVIRTHKYNSLAEYEARYPEHPDNHE